MAGPDFYKILGVSPSASADEIKAAHRELVKIFHPDLFSTSAEKARANKRLQQINEAYATLSNPGRRRRYDAGFSKSATAANGASAAATRGPSSSTPRSPSAAMAWTDLARRVSKKLRQLKQDYRVVAETERRRHQREKAFQKPRTNARTGPAKENEWIRNFRGLSEMGRNSAKRWKQLVSPKVTAIMAGAVILIFGSLILSAVFEESESVTAWGLLENTVNEPAKDSVRERQWISLGHYNTTSECAESLRKRVALDAQGGGKVFLDERSGTIAMTIYAKSEAVLAEEYLRAKLQETPTADRQLLEQQAKEEARQFVRTNGTAQRVKHYQCRELQLLKPESWLRTKLKQLGLI
jgi:curved DNA-binding protein CbpA